MRSMLLSILLFAILSILLVGCGGSSGPLAGNPPIEGKPHLGSANAKVTLVEFSDFECPFCSRAYQAMKQVDAHYMGKVKHVFKHFPLRSIHPYSQKAAEASECAADQGKFFEYHDVLFEHQDALDTANLKQYAADLRLNTEKFDQCLDSGAKAAAVEKDYQDGLALKVSGTPTLYINGQPYVGAPSFDKMKQLIDAELAKNT